MARCEECLHFDVCAREGRMVQIDEHTWDDYNQLDNVEQFCDKYVPAADVVPKSEISETVVKIVSATDKVICEAKSEVAREIFDELGDYASDFVAGHIDDDAFLQAIYNLRAKYTNPVHCKDCRHLMYSDHYGECSKGYHGIVSPEDSCEHGEKKI